MELLKSVPLTAPIKEVNNLNKSLVEISNHILKCLDHLTKTQEHIPDPNEIPFYEIDTVFPLPEELDKKILSKQGLKAVEEIGETFGENIVQTDDELVLFGYSDLITKLYDHNLQTLRKNSAITFVNSFIQDPANASLVKNFSKHNDFKDLVSLRKRADIAVFDYGFDWDKPKLKQDLYNRIFHSLNLKPQPYHIEYKNNLVVQDLQRLFKGTVDSIAHFKGYNAVDTNNFIETSAILHASRALSEDRDWTKHLLELAAKEDRKYSDVQTALTDQAMALFKREYKINETEILYNSALKILNDLDDPQAVKMQKNFVNCIKDHEKPEAVLLNVVSSKILNNDTNLDDLAEIFQRRSAENIQIKKIGRTV